jgi:hypothetical protein
MENSALKAWLKRKTARDAAANLFVASLALAAGTVVLTITFFFAYAIVWFGFNFGVSGFSQLLFNQRLHISHPAILLVCAVFLVLLFVGNARTSRDYLASLPKRNYVPSASMPGGAFGALGTLLAYPDASSRMIADLLFTGPRLMVAALSAFKKAGRLVRLDAEGCSRVLAVLLSRNSHFSCEEVSELAGVPDSAKVFRQMRDLDGVVFLQSEPAGLSLTSELREELGAAVTGSSFSPGTMPENAAADGTICELLGVAQNASPEEMEAAYEKWIWRSRHTIPGRPRTEREEQTEQQIRAVNAAYQAFLARQRTEADSAQQKPVEVEGLWRQTRRPRE